MIGMLQAKKSGLASMFAKAVGAAKSGDKAGNPETHEIPSPSGIAEQPAAMNLTAPQWRPKVPERETRLGEPLLNRPSYDATLPVGPYTRHKIFSENESPMNTIIMSHAYDPATANATMAAATRANPEVRFALLMDDDGLVDKETNIPFENPLADYPDFADRIDIIPTGERGTNVFTGVIGQFPRDGVMPGRDGLIAPLIGYNPRDDIYQASSQVADAFGASTHLPVYTHLMGKPGDQRVVTRQSTGEQFSLFGPESIEFAEAALKFQLPKDHVFFTLDTNSKKLFAISQLMVNMTNNGIPTENIMPVGRSNMTFGDVLDSTPTEALAMMPTHVLDRFDSMRDLPFPLHGAVNQKHAYHTDLLMFTPDGDTMYVNEDDHEENPKTREVLEFFGFDVVPLPAVSNFDPERYSEGRLSYVNIVMGVDPEGRTTALLPTEADNVNDLSENDRRVIALMNRHNPELQVIPVGMGTGVTYRFDRERQSRMANGDDPILLGKRDFQIRCSTAVMPYILTPRPTRSE